MVHQWISQAVILGLLVLLPRHTKADSISTTKTCFAVNKMIEVNFEKDVDSNLPSAWIGIYKADSLSGSNSSDLPEAELWVNLCGTVSCDPASNPSEGSVQFRAKQNQGWRQTWPLDSGIYQAVLTRGDDDATWPALAISSKFEVGCTTTDESNDANQPPELTIRIPEEELTIRISEETPVISVPKSCFSMNETIPVVFNNTETSFLWTPWIGIYATDRMDGTAMLPAPDLWKKLCGNTTCNTANNPSSGIVRFGLNRNHNGTQEWPLDRGTYRAVLTLGDGEVFRSGLAQSIVFRVGNCSTGTPTDGRVDAPTTIPTMAPVVATTPSPTVAPVGTMTPTPNSTQMKELIATVRSLIENVTLTSELLVGKFLRLAFHDCIGGCDGCVDMTFFDNIGLQTPIDVLKPIVMQYAGQGLSRTDIWMLAAVVAADVAEVTVNIDFPFNRIGRKTCEEIHSDGDCGNNSLGEPAICDASGGPHRPLCHGDIDGTSTIEQFMADEFGFDAQQTTAIMGAHTVGAMRAVNLGFEGRTGWDLTFDDLDNGYFVELVGNEKHTASNWTQVFRNNSDLPGKPPRFQFEADVKGVDLTMLNSDIALVRNLVEGENLMPSGEVTCTFSGPDACSSDTPFLPFVQAYAKSRGIFLVDFREALNLMIDNGYELETTCEEDEVCTLTSLF